MRVPLLVALVVLLDGCVSAFPDEVMRSVDRALTVAELQRGPMAHVNKRVMIGGEILATRPRPGETEMELLSRHLASDGSPERSDLSDGRVLIKTTEFLDPAVYGEGRRVTVVGTVTGEEQRKIGELD